MGGGGRMPAYIAENDQRHTLSCICLWSKLLSTLVEETLFGAFLNFACMHLIIVIT